MNEKLDMVEIICHINETKHLQLSEPSVGRLSDGTWTAILRTEFGSKNYAFSESSDGKIWTPAEYRGFVRNGDDSKPTFNHFSFISKNPRYIKRFIENFE